MSTTNALPKPAGAVPILGHLLSMARNPLGFLESLPDHDLIKLGVGTKDVILVLDPELTRQVLANSRVFDKLEWYGWLRKLTGDGLLACPHERQRRDRRLIQPAFQPSRLPDYVRTMTRQADTLTTGWRAGQELDVFVEMKIAVMSSAIESMFSATLPPQTLRKATEDLAVLTKYGALLTVLPPLLTWLPLAGRRRYLQASDRLRAVAGRVLAQRRSHSTDHDDMLAILLATRIPTTNNAEDRDLTDTEIIDQISTFSVAATETTAATLAWALHLLARHPDIEDRVHAEVDAVLAGAPAQLEHLPRLGLTGHVITEALRLYPPLWLAPRVATTDTQLGSHHIPAGTTVAYSPYLHHRRPDLYETPERFDPDRWDTTRGPLPPRHAYIAFSAGARKCIGDQFAITHATLMLATIAARWRLTPVSDWKHRPTRNMALTPDGLRMRVIPRR